MTISGVQPAAAKGPAEDTQPAPQAIDTQAQPRGQGHSNKRPVQDMATEPLDYGEESSGQPAAKKPAESRVPYQGRRIISYDD